MYTETFTFYFGHYCLDSLDINMYPPFYFFAKKSTFFAEKSTFLPRKSHSRHVMVGMNNFLVSPFIFNSLYQVGTAVCRSCGYVTTNIWEMSWHWVGVGRSCKHPYYKFAPTQPPSDSLGPLSPYQPPKALIPYGYLRPILGISWAYIDHIFALHIGPVTFSEHFQHTLTTGSPQLQNTS